MKHALKSQVAVRAAAADEFAEPEDEAWEDPRGRGRRGRGGRGRDGGGRGRRDGQGEEEKEFQVCTITHLISACLPDTCIEPFPRAACSTSYACLASHLA